MNKSLVILFCFCLVSSAKKAAKQTATTSKAITSTTTTAPEVQQPPTIDWGKCPQLEPKESDRVAKAAVLDSCLKTHPVPKNLTEESVEKHQKSIAECALKKEKWFTKSGSYRFSKAESEIKKKGLSSAIESQLLKQHKTCESEAKTEFSKKEQLIDQVQLYQACMDFHITEICGISVKSANP